MSSDTDIANFALSHLGYGKTVSLLDTERSAEANAVRRFYDVALEQILTEFNWPFAGVTQELALLEEYPEHIQWKYSYQYPSGCLNFRGIHTPHVRNTNLYDRIPYRIFNNPQGIKLIYTDQINAIGEFTTLIDDADKYPADFKLAFSYLLAAYIAPQIVQGDAQRIKTEMWNLYQFHSTRASARNANEEKEEAPPPSEFVQARDGGYCDDSWRWRR